MFFSLTYVAANVENYTPNLIAGNEYSGLILVNRALAERYTPKTIAAEIDGAEVISKCL